MNNEELTKFQNSIKEKLGDENISLIADDLGELITTGTNAFNKIQEQSNEIEKLKDDKEKLIRANGKLLQQVPMSEEPKKESEVLEHSFSFREQFDEKGRFKK